MEFLQTLHQSYCSYVIGGHAGVTGWRMDSASPAWWLNASSLGANTVNGPGPLRVSIKPAAVNAVASVLKLPAATAVSTMSFACTENVALIAKTEAMIDFFMMNSKMLRIKTS